MAKPLKKIVSKLGIGEPIDPNAKILGRNEAKYHGLLQAFLKSGELAAPVTGLSEADVPRVYNSLRTTYVNRRDKVTREFVYPEYHNNIVVSMKDGTIYLKRK